MGVLSFLAGLSAFFFTGFSTVLFLMPGLPKIVSVPPEPAHFAFSCQGKSLAGLILLYRSPFPPFTINKQIQCGDSVLVQRPLPFT